MSPGNINAKSPFHASRWNFNEEKGIQAIWFGVRVTQYNA